MEIGRAASEICRINEEMSQLIERHALSDKIEVRVWLCELLAGLNEKKTRVVNEVMK